MTDSVEATTTVRFELNRVYDRWPDINDPFGGSRQSGISPSRRVPAVFVFTGESGEQYGYEDHYDESGIFHYTGEGQVGDMQMSKGNLSIARHAADGRALHVFRSLGKSKGQMYVGEFVYVNHTQESGPDRNGNMRKRLVFHLVPLRTVEEDVLPQVTHAPDQDTPNTLAESRQRALSAVEPREGAGGSYALRSIYARSRDVREYVLMRANGRCEACGGTAPFRRPDGTPYLEAHHLTRLSDGGLDHPLHMAGLCPTCHREIHYGERAAERNDALRFRVRETEVAMTSL